MCPIPIFQILLAAPVHGAAVHPARVPAVQGAAQRGRQTAPRPTPDTAASGIPVQQNIGLNLNLGGH